MEKQNLNSGFIGLALLLLGTALIIFFLVRTDLFRGANRKNQIEQNKEAIDMAESARIKVESNSVLLE